MSDSAPDSDDVFNVERIRRLVTLMEDHDLREVDLRQAEQRIRLCRGIDAETMVAPSAVPVNHSVGPNPMHNPSQNAAAAEPAADDEHVEIIKSPMVGTFYTRANPSADPFVKVGDLVEPETTICIIEAMKVFNEIPAELRGKVVAVLVDDEEPVDHGRPLFKVDTSAI